MTTKPGRRHTVPTMVVAALYLVMLFAAPLIVRYAPQPEVAAAVAQSAR
jgi:hypothetical protein